MPTYNLVDEKWLPVITLSGEHKKVSLRDVFAEAHEIKEVFSNMPLEVISLNRFLQALVIRIYGVTESFDKWKAVWDAGKFDPQPANAYFNKWRHRFDLFDKERPFYQHPDKLSENNSPAGVISHEIASANNNTLFDHQYDSLPLDMKYGELAVMLIAAQTYAVGGGVSKPFNLAGAPQISGCVFWINEYNLFKNLLLNSGSSPNIFINEGTCAWEKVEPFKSEKRPYLDYLDYLTWQARRFNIQLPENLEELKIIEFSNNNAKLYRSQGDKLDGGDDSDSNFPDPLMAYRQGKGSNKGKIFQLRFTLDKSVWRDSEIVFSQYNEETGGNPRNMEWLAQNMDQIGYDLDYMFNLEVFGLVNDQAKVLLRKKDTLPYYPAIARDLGKQNMLSKVLQNAEDQAQILYFAAFKMGELLLYPSKKEDEKVSKDERKDINEFLKSLAIDQNYWASLETHFYEYLEKIARAEGDELHIIMSDWRDVTYKCTRNTFENVTGHLNSNAKQLKAVAKASRKIYKKKEAV